MRLFLGALTVSLLWGGTALAHDEWDWINKGGYRGPNGDHCCGKDDCYKLEAAEVEETTKGYSVPSHKVTVPYNQVLPSEDGKYWICRTSARMRCFFAPLNSF